MVGNEYVSKPCFTIEVKLENDYTMFLHWNIFNDKKDGNKLVMRVRYTLFDKNGDRQSLKVLDFKSPIEYKQVYLSDLNVFETITYSMFVYNNFNDWLTTEFHEMVNSGNSKVIMFKFSL